MINDRKARYAKEDKTYNFTYYQDRTLAHKIQLRGKKLQQNNKKMKKYKIHTMHTKLEYIC